MSYIAPERSVANERASFMTRVYVWMGLALIVSGITAFIAACATFEQFVSLAETNALAEICVDMSVQFITWFYLSGNGYTFWILAIVEIALVWWISAGIRKMSTTVAAVSFVAYSVVNGLTLSAVFMVYSPKSIVGVFGVSAALFFAMSLYGVTTKSDVLSYGRYFMMALIGLIVVSVVNMFMHSNMLDWIISVATVIIFTGITAYDTRKMLIISEQATDDDCFKKASIIGALELYIDFINIFLALLRLFGRDRD